MFKLFDRKTVFTKVLLGLCLIVILWNVNLSYENDIMISRLNRKINIFKFCVNKELLDMWDFLTVIATTAKETDINLLKVIDNTRKNIYQMEITQKELIERIKQLKKIDVENIDDIKKANLFIIQNKNLEGQALI